MIVEVAENAGACYGVQRALDMVYEAVSSGGSVQTLGPLIHNPRVVERLRQEGVSVADGVDSVSADTVVIRSHGVTPDVRDRLDELGIRTVDATCPHVLRAQRAAFDLAGAGKSVIVVGEEGHPEVQGLSAWAQRGGANVVVASSAEGVPESLSGPVGVVVQTTQRAQVLEDVEAKLRKMGIEAEVRNTICTATSKRQDSARALAEAVDCMVVIGGRNSSNTARLFEICESVAPKAFLVESEEDLELSMFEGVSRVGVTAGASTPEEHITAVVDCLRSW